MKAKASRSRDLIVLELPGGRDNREANRADHPKHQFSIRGGGGLPRENARVNLQSKCLPAELTAVAICRRHDIPEHEFTRD